MTAPTTLTTTIDDAYQHIAAEANVWVRVASVLRDDGHWYARLLEMTSGGQPPSWQDRTWSYPWAHFAGLVVPGSAVTRWLSAGKVSLQDHEIAIPTPWPQVSWERHQSHAPTSYESLEWPSVETTLAHVDMQGEPSGLLVSAAAAPSFLRFYTAAASFFWLDRQPAGGSLHQGVVYRHQDRRGRIASVRISESEIRVAVDGEAPMVVELAGDAPGSTADLQREEATGRQVAAFPLEGRLPAGAWVLLRLKDEWIDRRFLETHRVRGTEAGVEFVEPRTKLEVFLANREGPEVEFKGSFPERGGAATVMKTVCAFANGTGGSILFGIDDDGNVLGVTADSVASEIDRLTALVDDWVDPAPHVGFETLPTDDTTTAVLVMRVEPDAALHGSGSRGGQPSIFVRHFARTVMARPAEIEALVRARGGSPAGGLPGT